MMCAISAAESESVNGGIDDRDLDYLGGVIVSQSEGSAVVSFFFFIIQKRLKVILFLFPSAVVLYSTSFLSSFCGAVLAPDI